ncbi:MAG TPA: YihY/virulence factor BrkB family protein [Steroidobacteraceae bacterium]|nr:YihY/virulence factor BrkB family protein [Steroidobacteraceae bacterium]
MADGVSLWQKLWHLLDRALFGTHTLGDGLGARALRVLRYPYAILRDLLGGELTLRATGLVYTTLLALIPLIALSFGLLKAIGAHRELEPVLLDFFRPVGAAGPEITHRLMQFAENVSGGLVGVVGFALLLWTLVGTVKKIEDSLNFVWRVQRARSIARRMIEFAALLIVGPIVIAAVIGFSKLAFDSVAGHGASVAPLVKAAIGLAPYALVTGLFTAIYILMPNTKVRLVPALVGGLAAGISWAAIGKAFTAMVLYTSRLTLVYAGFAAIVAVFVWTYLGWLILLAGAQLAFYLQNPQNLRLGHSPLKLSNRERERLALEIMARVALQHHNGEPPCSVDQIARTLALPGATIADMTEQLEHAGLLVQSDEGRLFPAREISGIRLTQIIGCARSRSTGHEPYARPYAPGVRQLQQAIEQAWHSACGDRTLADLITETEEVAPAARAQQGSHG